MTHPKPGVEYVREYRTDGAFLRVRLDRLTDGRIMCCLCFEYVTRNQLAPIPGDPDKAVQDVCQPCANHEKKATRTTLRVLITGSRTWTNVRTVTAALDRLYAAAKATDRTLVLVHGDCPRGADNIAKTWLLHKEATLTGKTFLREEAWPAPWHSGRSAGVRRNADMVRAGADICLAFICDNSAGASHCSDAAEKANIPVAYWREDRAEIYPPDASWIKRVGL